MTAQRRLFIARPLSLLRRNTLKKQHTFPTQPGKLTLLHARYSYILITPTYEYDVRIRTREASNHSMFDSKSSYDEVYHPSILSPLSVSHRE